MTDAASPDTTKDKKPWTRSVEFWSLLLGALASIVAIATFLGLQVEKHKRLDLVYRAKLSFFNPDIHSTQKVSVLYDGRPISQLTKISALVINSGPIPIEKRDVERPSVLQFDDTKARIIEAHIVQKSPPGLEATVTTESNAVRIAHGLLNPGNSFAFEILLDGDPGSALPILDSRISGVEPSTRVISGDVQAGNLLFSRRRNTQLAIIIVTTILLGLVGFVTLLGTFETAKKIFAKVAVSAEQMASFDAKFKPERVVKELYFSLPQDLRPASAGSPQESWLDDSRNIPIQSSPNATGEARRIWVALRGGLKEKLAQNAYFSLPFGLDNYVRQQIRKMSFAPETGQSAIAFIDAALLRAQSLASNPLPIRGRLASARGDLVIVTMLLLAAPFVTVTAIGIWQLFLAGR